MQIRTHAVLLAVGIILLFAETLSPLWSGGIAWAFAGSTGMALMAGALTAMVYERRSVESMRRFLATLAAVEGKKAMEDVAHGTFDAVVTRLENIYHDYVPTRVFENTAITRDFNGFFNRWLADSDSYRYRGDIAATTTFQLHQIWAAHPPFIDRNRAYFFLLMDPRSKEAYIQRAHLRLEATTPVDNPPGAAGALFGDEKEIERRREYAEQEIRGAYVSLYALLMAARRYKVNIKVGFYSEVPFYRCELLQGGMFINYYIRGAFAGAFFYKRGSLLYHAFSEAFDLAFEHSTKAPDLMTVDDGAFVTFLRDSLAFPQNGTTDKEVLEALSAEKEKRFDGLATHLSALRHVATN